jgi:abhydrolase domain-containing protein 6
MGGNIAGIYAARYPSEVTSLWLLAPGGVVTSQPSELSKRWAAGEWTAGENPMLIDSVAAFDRVQDLAFVEPPYIPGPIKRVLAERAIAHRAFNEKIFRDVMAFPLPLEPALRGSTVPTLITWGAQDRILHISGAPVLASLVRHGQVAILEHTGHIPMLEKPQESAMQFLHFRGITPEPRP